MSSRPGFDFRGRQISPATRADWRHDARPTNYDGGRTATLARRIIELLDALEEAEASLAQAWADGYNHAEVRARTGIEPPPFFEVRGTACKSGSDGDCDWILCPQLRDNEPRASGRHCPRDRIKGSGE